MRFAWRRVQSALRRRPCLGAQTLKLGTDRVGVIDQVSPPAKISFLITAWTPQFPSTTWVMPKSTPIVIKEIASSSVSFLVVIRNLRILRNASRKARSTDDFE